MIATAVVTVERTRIYHRASRTPFTWSYEAFGLDGKRFDNSSIVALREVLRRNYPGATIVEPWKAS